MINILKSIVYDDLHDIIKVNDYQNKNFKPIINDLLDKVVVFENELSKLNKKIDFIKNEKIDSNDKQSNNISRND